MVSFYRLRRLSSGRKHTIRLKLPLLFQVDNPQTGRTQTFKQSINPGKNYYYLQPLSSFVINALLTDILQGASSIILLLICFFFLLCHVYKATIVIILYKN